MTWTDERVMLLRKLLKQNWGASAIAASVGDVTRTEVIRKAHRMGLTGQLSSGWTRAARPATSPAFARPNARKLRP